MATVSAADVPTFFRSADPEGFQKLVEESGRARTEEALGGPVRMVPVLPDTVGDSTPASVREFYDYYKTPGPSTPAPSERTRCTTPTCWTSSTPTPRSTRSPRARF